jgi:hypothetical protein
VPTERCEERAALTTAVVDAIDKVYVARRDLEAARAEKAETERLVIALNNVRAAEQHAVSALDKKKNTDVGQFGITTTSGSVLAEAASGSHRSVSSTEREGYRLAFSWKCALDQLIELLHPPSGHAHMVRNSEHRVQNR